MMLVLARDLGLNVYLYVVVPKGFFPQQDTGRLVGDPGRPEHLVPADAAEADAVRRHRQAIRRSTPWSASPAAARPIPASCSSR
jgi:multidrug efflux pump subunit AcrB